jgi:phosphoenolpyruvate-protein phosphotransferase (PTS system enzyme I)
MPEPSKSGEKIFRGIPVSPGVCRAKILVMGKAKDAIPISSVTEEELPHELERLERALIRTRQQILEVQRKVGEAMGADDASIFDAHLLVLEDRTLLDEVSRVMHVNKVNVAQAFHEVAEKYAATLGAIDDDYLRERATDMRDVTARILNNLLDRPQESDLRSLREPVIVMWAAKPRIPQSWRVPCGFRPLSGCKMRARNSTRGLMPCWMVTTGS